MYNMYTTQNHYSDGKKPDIKKVHTVWSHLYEILENDNQSIGTKNTSVVAYTQGFREKWNAAKDEETPRDDGNFLILDGIIQNSLKCTL